MATPQFTAHERILMLLSEMETFVDTLLQPNDTEGSDIVRSFVNRIEFNVDQLEIENAVLKKTIIHIRDVRR